MAIESVFSIIGFICLIAFLVTGKFAEKKYLRRDLSRERVWWSLLVIFYPERYIQKEKIKEGHRFFLFSILLFFIGIFFLMLDIFIGGGSN